MKRYIDFDIALAYETFHLEGERLIRTSSDKDCTDQNGVRMFPFGKIQPRRIIYALLHGIVPMNQLIRDDDNQLVQVNDNIYALFSNRNFPKVLKLKGYQENQPKLYLGKVKARKGKRITKAFKTAELATEWQRMTAKDIYGKEVAELNLTKTMFVA